MKFWQVPHEVSAERFNPEGTLPLGVVSYGGITPRYGFFDHNGMHQNIQRGDWIVTIADGRRSVVTPDDFAKDFRAVPQMVAVGGPGDDDEDDEDEVDA